jgi:hypothetical protein
MTVDTVRFYDSKTNCVSTIPARELAPGIILARVEGIEGEVFVEASQINSDRPLRHPPFDVEVRALLTTMWDALADVLHMTLEEWEHGFRKDTHPEREIAIWLNIVEAYQHFTAGRPLGLGQKKDIFAVIMNCFNVGVDIALLVTNCATLSKKRQRQIVDWIRMAAPASQPLHLGKRRTGQGNQGST